jgi:hypothetical protein
MRCFDRPERPTRRTRTPQFLPMPYRVSDSWRITSSIRANLVFRSDTFAEAERLFSAGAIWNNRLGSMLIQFLAQLGAIIRFVAGHAFRRVHSADQALSDRTIVCFASSQRDGDQAPFNICECMDLRVTASARAANSLLLLSLFLRLPSGALLRASLARSPQGKRAGGDHQSPSMRPASMRRRLNRRASAPSAQR